MRSDRFHLRWTPFPRGWFRLLPLQLCLSSTINFPFALQLNVVYLHRLQSSRLEGLNTSNAFSSITSFSSKLSKHITAQTLSLALIPVTPLPTTFTTLEKLERGQREEGISPGTCPWSAKHLHSLHWRP